MLRSFTRLLFPVDLLTILFSAGLAVLSVAFHPRVPHWPLVLAVSGAIVVGLPLLAAARASLRDRSGLPAGATGVVRRVLEFLHDWTFAPLAYVIYLEMQGLVGPLRGPWLADPHLIAIDRWLLGSDASVLLARLATPWLTEVAQVAYTSFYALMVIVGAELYARRDMRRFQVYAFSCALGFFISFVGYLAVPAVGPRFTLFDVATVERQLPGLLLTPALRLFVDGGGLVPPGLSRQATLALAPRDVFPSGLTMMTLVAMYWSGRYRLKVRWGIWPVGAVLVFATVYLRYHYLVDLLAGGLLAALCVSVTPSLYRAFQRCSAPAPQP
jgi:membrane-associated phospholipid phosphatase